MPIDPHAPQALTNEGRTAERLATVERRLNALETAATIQALTAAGPPATAPRNGTAAVGPEPRLWLRVAGVWRYTDLS